MDISKNIRIVRNYNKNTRSLKYRIIKKIFKRIFLSWCTAHLGVAKETGIITNKELHYLDAQMKGELGFPGYPQ